MPNGAGTGSAPTNGTVTIGDRTIAAGERQGVSLEDKPLTRQTSTGLKRTASQWKRAAQKAFEPMPKQTGDKRVLLMVADGSEEIETLAAYDIFVRASLAPVLCSVSPQFSPSHSLPHITLSRGARVLADAQFENMKQEYKDAYFDAVVVPGGAKGAERLSKDPGVQALLRQYYESQRLVGCICAGTYLSACSRGQADRVAMHRLARCQIGRNRSRRSDHVPPFGQGRPREALSVQRRPRRRRR